MPEVESHLVPEDGISDATVGFAGLDAEGSGAIIRFDVRQDDDFVGTFHFHVDPDGKGIDSMVARAHQMMNDALRQMLFRNDALRKAYEK